MKSQSLFMAGFQAWDFRSALETLLNFPQGAPGGGAETPQKGGCAEQAPIGRPSHVLVPEHLDLVREGELAESGQVLWWGMADLAREAIAPLHPAACELGMAEGAVAGGVEIKQGFGLTPYDFGDVGAAFEADEGGLEAIGAVDRVEKAGEADRAGSLPGKQERVSLPQVRVQIAGGMALIAGPQ